VAIEPQTGQVKAWSRLLLPRQQFNRAVQAPRQTGSGHQAALYTAALEHGFTPASVIIDEPVTFIDRWNGEPWSPKNYDRRFKGAVTLRTGLEQSRNVVTATLLDNISPRSASSIAGASASRRLSTPISRSAWDVRGHAARDGLGVLDLPNKGVRFRPTSFTRIEDKDGNVLEKPGWIRRRSSRRRPPT